MNGEKSGLDRYSSDRRWLLRAIEESTRCPRSVTAFSVGAVLVDADDKPFSTGYSRETDSHVHAEESALEKLDPDDVRLPTATMYSSLEPCSKRKSRPRSCAQLILSAGIRRVVFAWREPAIFVDGDGATVLRNAGVEVVEFTELAAAARVTSAHLLTG